MNIQTSDIIITESTSGQQIFQLRLWHHLLLCAALFTNEVAITYELIYMVTWEKLLGLPVQYVSLAGVVSSAISFIITPALARLGDYGDRFQRKSLLVVASGGCMFVGAACLLAGCVIKMRLSEDSWKCKAYLPLLNDSTYSIVINTSVLSENTFNRGSDNCTDSLTNDHEGEPLLPVMSVLSVVAFILVNTGYNTGCSYIRGFMLECAHKSQHSKVLSIGVIMSAVGGCVVALIGLINLDNSTTHSTDPNLVRAVALSLLLMVAVVVTIPTTLMHGRYLFQKLNEGKPATVISTHVSFPEQTTNKEDYSETRLSNGIEDRIKLMETYGKQITYNSLADVSHAFENQDKLIVNAAKETDEPKADSLGREHSFIRQSQQEDQKAKNCNGIDNSGFISTSDIDYQLNGVTAKSLSPDLKEEMGDKIKVSCWDNVLTCFWNLVKFFQNLLSSIMGIWKSYKKFSLLLSCLLCFFTAGANAIFEIYFTNFLAEGVYKGNGEASQEDVAKQRYDMGIQTASIGTFVFQFVFLIYNAAHQKISTETGLVYEFLVMSCLMVPSLLAFVLTESLVAFYVTIVLNGAYRTLVFTTPFILASETMRMSEDGRINDVITTEVQDDSYGSVISTVGAMMPLSFLLSSCLMGPLLGATLDPASPMYFVAAAAMGAIVVLEDTECRSLVKKHLTRTKLDSLKKLKTKYGGTLAHCIRSGCLNTDTDIGIYACDPDAYKTFGDIFIPVIKEYHVVTGALHPSVNFGERLVRLDSFGFDTDPVQIESTTISVARSLEGFPFPPLLTTAKRKHLEDMSKVALLELRGDFRGVYCPLATMGKETMKALTKRNLLFVNNNRFLDSAGVYKQWPEGRGIFYNDKKNFAAWVNEEDHLRLTCTQSGGDIRKIYLRTISALRLLESSGLTYAWKEYLGMTCCFREDTGPAEAERLWKQLKHDVCSTNSLLAKHFTKDKLKELKSVKTTYGGTLVHQIKTGVLHPELEIGLYASDQDAYTAFAPLYDPIIKDYYGVKSLEHPETTFGTHEELAVLEEVDPNCKYIQKVQLELRRNLDGYPFASIITKDKRDLIEKTIKQMCTQLWCGRYVSMLRLHEDMYEFLAKADLVMKDDNKYLRTAGAYRVYPFQRGIWGTCVPWCFNPTFVYVNHEDHLRLFSIEYNSKLIECYKRMVTEIVALRLQHFFAKRKGLGYLTFCPSNLGTAMKVTVRLKLPNLSKEPNFKETCESNDLLVSKVASSQETTTEPEDVLYELTNKRKFGLTEIDLIRQVRNGLEKVVEEEKKLDGKK